MSNSSISPLDGTQPGATTLGQCGPDSNSNKRVLYIPQISKAGALPSNYLVLYPGLLLGKFYPSAEMQSVYSTTPADWTDQILHEGPSRP